MRYEMWMTEVLLMQELGISKSDIDNLSIEDVHAYVVIIGEMGKMRKEKAEAHVNG